MHNSVIFNNVFSLGSHCEPAIQFERHFGKRPQSPFDFLICPTESLLKILGDDGALFGKKITFAMNGESVLCVNYGCLYHHEFERDSNARMMIDSESLKNCNEKLTYKYSKMFEISRYSSPLFVRFIHPSEYPTHPNEPVYSYAIVKKIISMLKDKLRHENFHIAFIATEKNYHTDYLLDEKLFADQRVSLFYEPCDNDQSRNKAWDLFFKKFGF